MLVDTHCHLDFSQFDPDRDAVIQRARDAGISYLVNVGSTLDSSNAACELAAKYAQVYAGIGVHPHEADSFNQEAEGQLRKLALKDKVVAIGETGLDYYRNLSSEAGQIHAFSQQIKLAKDLNLPLVVHSRQAEKQVVQVLKTAMPIRAVIHCFSGDETFLKECLDSGFFVSFTCNITYKKAQGLRDMVRITPLEKLMLETDAPYLSPEGFRGKRNEPMQIKLLAETVSLIKGVSIEKVADKTTKNAKEFFKLG
ncbi:MAG: TatD family hydrolase [Candidatus Omnitrophica bacterium]|nr:TatD family hydrolase [Candidatus Omnitrophota bacterium]MBU1922662.1 TatD family hydrolase [Candidatus Omnitrophota bacterium]